MAVSKMLGHASYVTTLTVYADYITECDSGKATPLGRPVASTPPNVVPNASAAGGLARGRACQSSFSCEQCMSLPSSSVAPNFCEV